MRKQPRQPEKRVHRQEGNQKQHTNERRGSARYIKRKMDELMRKAIKQVEEAKKRMGGPGGQPRTPWTPDRPHPQPYYAFDGDAGAWTPRQPASSGPSSGAGSDTGIGRLALFSWNIDFMLPRADERMQAALAHLESRVAPLLLSRGAADVIFIQECVVSDLELLAATPWVREHFYLTDVAASAVGGEGGGGSGTWASGHYGTVTLVDRRLPVRALFRVHYRQTRMDRDALFVDVGMRQNGSSGASEAGAGPVTEERSIRLCNTHLESLALDPPFRPPQVQVFAAYMHGSSPADDGNKGAAAAAATGTAITAPHGAVAAGDFNAIQDFDRTLHADNGLRDAFLELGGREDGPGAATWGQQAATELRERFGCSRSMFSPISFRPSFHFAVPSSCSSFRDPSSFPPC